MNYRKALNRLLRAIRLLLGDRGDVTRHFRLNPHEGCEAVRRRFKQIDGAFQHASFADVSAMVEEMELCRLAYAIYVCAQSRAEEDVPISLKDIAIVENSISARIHGGGGDSAKIREIALRVWPNISF